MFIFEKKGKMCPITSPHPHFALALVWKRWLTADSDSGRR